LEFLKPFYKKVLSGSRVKPLEKHPKDTPCRKPKKGGSFGGRFVHPDAVGVPLYASAREGQKKRQLIKSEGFLP